MEPLDILQGTHRTAMRQANRKSISYRSRSSSALCRTGESDRNKQLQTKIEDFSMIHQGEVTELPNSKEAERMVLGCMLFSTNALDIGSELLCGADFYFEDHKLVFQVLHEAHRNERYVDTFLVWEELKNHKEFNGIDGIRYLTALGQYPGTSANFEEYAEIVRSKSILRKIITASQETIRSAQKDPQNLVLFIDHAQEKIRNLSSEYRNSFASQRFKHLLDITSEEDIAQEFKNTSPGVNVGFRLGKDDIKIPGGAISIIAAPTSHGKTTVLINFCLGALAYPGQENCAVHFFSYEESKAAIISLFLNTFVGEVLSHNNRWSIQSYFRDGDMTYMSGADLSRYGKRPARQIFPLKKKEFFDRLINTKKLNVHYSDWPTQELVSAIKFLKKETNVQLVVIDYMQLLKFGVGKFASRQEELKHICLLLKDCAVETGLPILIAAQFNRTVISEADLSPTNIGEAGDIERVANLIIGFWNRNFEGFSSKGNVNKSNPNQKIPKQSAIYMEILKARVGVAGLSGVFDFDGNIGKLSHREKDKVEMAVPDDDYGTSILSELKNT